MRYHAEIFDLFSLSDPTIDAGDPKIDPKIASFLPDPRQVHSTKTVQVMPSDPKIDRNDPKNFSSYALETEFDFCDLENQGHDPKTNRLPQGPMGTLYNKYQYDSCNTF